MIKLVATTSNRFGSYLEVFIIWLLLLSFLPQYTSPVLNYRSLELATLTYKVECIIKINQ